MTTTMAVEEVSTLHIVKEIEIAAAVPVVWDAVLDELGPKGQMPDGKPFSMTLEAWPGGRWFRDLGNKTGHLWGHVQVIKPPMLLELCGPMFMSYPAVSHVQYRLATEGKGTRLKITHRAMGQITQEHREGVHMGWEHGLKRIRELAEGK